MSEDKKKKRKKKRKDDDEVKEQQDNINVIRARLQDADKATDDLFEQLLGNPNKQIQEKKKTENDYSEVPDIALYGPQELRKLWAEKQKTNKVNEIVKQQEKHEVTSNRSQKNDNQDIKVKSPENEESATDINAMPPKSESDINMMSSKSKSDIDLKSPNPESDINIKSQENVSNRLTLENLQAIFNKINTLKIPPSIKLILQQMVLFHGLKFYSTYTQMAEEIGMHRNNMYRIYQQLKEAGANIQTSRTNSYIDLTPIFSDVIVENDYKNVTIPDNSPMYMYIYIYKYKTYIQRQPGQEPDIPEVQDVIDIHNGKFLIKNANQFYTLIAPLYHLELKTNKINVHSAQKILEALLNGTLYRTIAYIKSRARVDNKIGYLMKTIENDYGKTMSEEDIEKVKEIARAYYLVSSDNFLELYSIFELHDILNTLDMGLSIRYSKRDEYVEKIKNIKEIIKQLGDTILSKIETISMEEYIKSLGKNPLR